MKIFIIIFSFFVILSSQAKLIKIDMQINNDEIYAIENKDNNIDYSFLYRLNVRVIPENILNLIIQTLINNNIMDNCFPDKYRNFKTFYCSRNLIRGKIDSIKLNFIFDNCTKTFDVSNFCSRKNSIYFFGFLMKPPKKDKNLRLLSSDNETEKKSENMTNANANHNAKEVNEKKGKSGIGWLGISLIILLSLIVIYVIYVGFRYYRRKKYQNPSFYYKITEEMFDDITPIE